MESKINNNEENELEKKKQFLREEILNKGYNGNDFLNFCLNKKKYGDDLAYWEFDELKQCVKEFQTQINNQSEQIQKKTSTSMKNFLFANFSQNNNNNINQKNYLQSSQINQKINENIQNVNIGSHSDNYNDNNNNYNYKIYKKEIHCKILEKSELNSKKNNS